MNKFLFTCQHTCKKGSNAYLIYHAPFLSEKEYDKKTKKTKYPFLDNGYYLWEDNIEMAHDWGRRNYNNEYSIIQYSSLEILECDLLDFTNRASVKAFNELRSKYISKNNKCKNWLLAEWIAFFKKLKINESNEFFFPWKFIKATEHKKDWENSNINEKITLGWDYYTFCNPINVICCVDKNDLKCEGKVIY